MSDRRAPWASWFTAPPQGDPELQRKARLLARLLRTMLVLGSGAAAISLLDPRNDLSISAAFYVPLFIAFFAFHLLMKRGYVEVVAWSLSGAFWVLIAFVTLFFGGLTGHNGTVFAVSIMVVGSVIGGRSAMALTVLTSGWCAVVAALELTHRLPPQLGPYSPINAWTALTLSFVMMSALLDNSLTSLRELHDQAAEAARQRDEALKRSFEAQKLELVGSLANGVAHDFNNLLAVIAGASHHLRQRAATDRDTVESLDDLDAATDRASWMTRQLLSFGRTSQGAAGPIDLERVVRELQSMLPRLLGPDIRATITTPGPTYVHASRVGLEQVLLNLIVNARDAMPAGGEVRVAVRAIAATGVLEVTDTGVGMSPEVQARIFQPFFTTKSTGTGLGLATVRRLVEEFGGHITVTSQVGAGTTLEIHLRAVPPPEEPSLPREQVRPNTPARERVLLVEDDLLVRRALTRLLTQMGFEVIAVANGLEALGLLEQAPDVTVVVSDIAMPAMNGLELARRLAELRPTLPVVLVSGNTAPGADVIAVPHRAFIEKPASLAALSAAIAHARQAPTA